MSVAGVSASPPPAESFRGRTIRGTIWTFGGYGASQVLRLATNVILAGWLLPHPFGLMAIVMMVMQGLNMFTDIGIGPSIVRHSGPNASRFLCTAFTVQAARGAMIWGAAALAAYPLAWVYTLEPGASADRGLLAGLIVVAGSVSAINGLASTGIYALNKSLAIARLTLLELATSVLGSVVTIVAVHEWRNAWGLVVGGIAAGAAKAIASHTLIGAPPVRFGFDRQDAAEIARFGRWVFASTAVAFVAERGNILVMGLHLTKTMLGIFNNALMFATAVDQGLGKLWQTVLFPLYVKLHRQGGAHMRPRLAQVRLALLGIGFPPLALLVFFGQHLVDVLYDEPAWHESGWMLRVLAAGQLLMPRTTVHPLLLAVGDSYRFTLLNAVTAGTQIAAMLIGGAISGDAGLIVGVAIAPILAYPYHAALLKRYGMWMPGIDLAHVAAATATILVAFRVI